MSSTKNKLLIIKKIVCKQSPQLPTKDTILEECRQLANFPVMSRSTERNVVERTWVFLQTVQKRSKCINDLILTLCIQPATLLKTRLWHWYFLVNFEDFSACNFIKSETHKQMFSCKFWEVFQPASLLKTRLRQRRFLVILGKA